MTRRMSFVLSLVAVIAAEALLIRLAVWQFNRMEDKEALKAAMVTQMAHEPLDLAGLEGDETVAALADMTAWQPVHLQGRLDGGRALQLAHQALDSRRGERWLAPLVLPGGGYEVIVDLGWQPAGPSLPAHAQGVGVSKSALTDIGYINVTGILRRPPKRTGWLGGPDHGAEETQLWFLDLAAFPPAEDIIRAPVYVQATAPVVPGLQAVADPLPSGAKHQEYMLTWAGLAVALPLLYLGLGISMRRRGG